MKPILHTAAAVTLWATGSASAQVYTGPYGPGGTYNVYSVVTTAATWENANTAALAALASSRPAVPGGKCDDGPPRPDQQ